MQKVRKDNSTGKIILLALLCFLYGIKSIAQTTPAKAPFMPTLQEINRPFSNDDIQSFRNPPKVDYPETWFHFIGGNVSKEGITTDLEAIAKAGFSGIHLFHGQFGGVWPGVPNQITCLSPQWDDAVKHTAAEANRLGLKFLMNNTPGWATSGGPWIKPSNAMRTLIWQRTNVTGGPINQIIPTPQPSTEPWRDYKDIAVLAFPTPDGDQEEPLTPQSATSDTAANWITHFTGESKSALQLAPSAAGQPHWIEVTFANNVLLRSVEFPSINRMNTDWAYEPGIKVTVQAILPDGTAKEVANVDMPESNWQDDKPTTLACSEAAGVNKYRIYITNKHGMAITSLRLFTAARKNNWESEAAWVLRSIVRTADNPKQSAAAFINPDSILDISSKMDKDGRLMWDAPAGNWTVLRFGHVNLGKENGPAPKEATGWETNKLATSGADAQFTNYIGRLSAANGPLAGAGILNGMLMDSWECNTQSWTDNMENEFKRTSSYQLREWLPALLGYVVKDHETTGRFLTDWRRTLSDLFTNNFYGRMASLAHARGLNFTFETSAGDVLPGDILEYFKYADVPMCEFWQPMSDRFVGSINFKPIKPTASAARIYGKTRVAAESFTNISLSWDEHFEKLREDANINATEGVTHFVFHTYTHNPEKPFLAPGSSFGAGIGTPFIRGETWWQYMPDFNKYLSRLTYMLERGKPVSDVLWYLGDELDHKPDQNAPFPEGFKYDYCNPDVLLNRLTVENGMLVTPEGIKYKVLWLPNARRMLPATLKKILALVQAGANVVGEAPIAPATLTEGIIGTQKFAELVLMIWGGSDEHIRKVGKGCVISGITLDKALATLNLQPDVTGGDALWLHRYTKGADWYFISTPKGKGFTGDLSFNMDGNAEIWDAVTGTAKPVASQRIDGRTNIKLSLDESNACFVVFKHSNIATANVKTSILVSSSPIAGTWKISFPTGWGISAPLTVNELKPWKDLDLSPEGKAFSGTATYTTKFTINNKEALANYVLDLGEVDMVASVTVNGKPLGNLLAPPYRFNLNDAIKAGENKLEVKVTSTWFNRLAFDAAQPEVQRKTWTINGPGAGSALRNSGLIEPVKVEMFGEK